MQQLCADGPPGRCPCSTGRGGRKVAPAANVSRCQSARPAIHTSTNTTQNAATNTQPTTQPQFSQVCSSYQTQPHLRLIVTSRTFGEYL